MVPLHLLHFSVVSCNGFFDYQHLPEQTLWAENVLMYFVIFFAVSSFSVGILFHESPLCALVEEVSQLDSLTFASALALQNA